MKQVWNFDLSIKMRNKRKKVETRTNQKTTTQTYVIYIQTKLIY